MREAATICPAPVTLTFDLESGVRVTCDVGYLCANFSLPRSLCSRLRPDVRDRRQTDRRQTASSLNSPAPRRGHNKAYDWLIYLTKQPQYTVFHKNDPVLNAITSTNADQFSKLFTIGLSSDCVMNWSLKITSHLKRVDTLPCKTLVFKNWSNERVI